MTPDAILFPNLETERLYLRRLSADDVQSLFALYASEPVTRFTLLETITTLKQAEDELRRQDDLYARGAGMRWGVFSLETNALLGTCGFHHWNHRDYRAEISYDLAPQHWGQGIMREALQAILSCGFFDLDLHRIEALVDPLDLRSQNLLYGLDFEMEGILRHHTFTKGTFHDDMVFALLSPVNESASG